MRLTGADAHEVDVDRLVGRGMELHLARDRAQLGAVEIEVDEAREEAFAGIFAPELARIDRDEHRRLAVAIDDARHASGAAGGAGGPFAARSRAARRVR